MDGTHQTALLEIQYILHIIKTVGGILQKFSGTQRTFGEGVAAGSLVGEFDPFTAGNEDHGVVTDHVAAAEGVHTDFSGGAFADFSGSAVADGFIVIPVACFADHFAQPDSGTAGGVDLLVMVHFDDFDVEFFSEYGCGFLDQFKEQIDADAHISGDHQSALFAQFLQCGAFFGAHCRDSADKGGIVGNGNFGTFNCTGGGEIYNGIDLGIFKHSGKRGGYWDIQRLNSGDASGILTEQRTPFPIDGSDDLEVSIFDSVGDNTAAHASGGSDNSDIDHNISSPWKIFIVTDIVYPKKQNIQDIVRVNA